MEPTTGLIAQANPVGDLLDAAAYFGDAASVDPIAALLIVLGNLLMVFSIGFFAYLTLGAAVDYVIPETSGRAPPRRE